MQSAAQSPTHLSPADFEPFSDLPGCLAVARDTEGRLLWCNAQFANAHGRTVDTLRGTPREAISSPALAEERARFETRAMREREAVTYLHFSLGRRWLARVWPLDPKAFGTPGVFVVHKLSSTSGLDGHDESGVPLARVGDLGELSRLTPRELEVYYHLAKGMTVNEIGEMLDRSPKTVERHLESVHRKMGFGNRAALVRDAVERGVVAFSAGEWLGLTNIPGRAG